MAFVSDSRGGIAYGSPRGPVDTGATASVPAPPCVVTGGFDASVLDLRTNQGLWKCFGLVSDGDCILV